MVSRSRGPAEPYLYPTEDTSRLHIMTDLKHSRLIECYERGTLAESEVLMRLMPIVADSKDAWLSLSNDWRERILDAVHNAPREDEDWDSMRVFHAGAWTSQEAFDESERRNGLLLLEYRRGVETFRDTMSPETAD